MGKETKVSEVKQNFSRISVHMSKNPNLSNSKALALHCYTALPPKARNCVYYELRRRQWKIIKGNSDLRLLYKRWLFEMVLEQFLLIYFHLTFNLQSKLSVVKGTHGESQTMYKQSLRLSCSSLVSNFLIYFPVYCMGWHNLK